MTLLIWVMIFPPTIFIAPRLAQARFVTVPAEPVPKDDEHSFAVATGDIDRDGNAGLDLILSDVHGSNRLLLNDGRGHFALAPETHLPARSQVSMGLALGDVDRDRDLDLDLLLATPSGQNRFLLNVLPNPRLRLAVSPESPREVGQAITLTVRRRGDDVLSVKESMQGEDDRPIWQRAEAEQRLVVTQEKDFGELAFRLRLPASCGVILFRLSGMSPSTGNQRILDVLDSRSDWTAYFSVVTDNRIRMRPLPSGEASA